MSFGKVTPKQINKDGDHAIEIENFDLDEDSEIDINNYMDNLKKKLGPPDSLTEDTGMPTISSYDPVNLAVTPDVPARKEKMEVNFDKSDQIFKKTATNIFRDLKYRSEC